MNTCNVLVRYEMTDIWTNSHSSLYSPNSKSEEQTGRTSIHETTTDGNEQRRANSTTNTDKLNVTRLQFSMSIVVTDSDAASVVCWELSDAIVGFDRCDHRVLAGSSPLELLNIIDLWLGLKATRVHFNRYLLGVVVSHAEIL